MTTTELAKITPEEKRVKIAEACGWTDCNYYEDNAGPGFWNGYPPTTVGVDKSGEWQAVKAQYHNPLPDYLNDLNAMHKAEKTLTWNQKHVLHNHLRRMLGDSIRASFASASQRADAFLLTYA